MSTDTMISINSVFEYIRSEYGSSVLETVQNSKNDSIVNRVFDASVRTGKDVPHTANKIIAMLRLIPN